jgi:hypothetical protein
MPLPRTLLLTSDHDLDLSHGISLTTDLKTYVKQKILQRLRYFLGEWFLDRRQGVPYFERVFVENPDISFLTSLYRRIILGTRGVGGLESIELRFDRPNRTLLVSFVARLADSQETITVTEEPFILESPGEAA